MWLQLILWASTLFSFMGYYYLNRKNVRGYKLFFIGNILTIFFDAYTKNFAQLIMFAIFLYFNLDGIKRWKKEESTDEIYVVISKEEELDKKIIYLGSNKEYAFNLNSIEEELCLQIWRKDILVDSFNKGLNDNKWLKGRDE